MTKNIQLSTLRPYLIAAPLALAVACALGAAPTSASAQRREAAAESPADPSGVVNIQTANQAELELLPGVGPARAAAIVAFRADHPFRRVEDIMRVRGIGRAMFRRMRSHLTVEGATTLHTAIGMGPRGAATPAPDGEDDGEASD